MSTTTTIKPFVKLYLQLCASPHSAPRLRHDQHTDGRTNTPTDDMPREYRDRSRSPRRRRRRDRDASASSSDSSSSSESERRRESRRHRRRDRDDGTRRRATGDDEEEEEEDADQVHRFRTFLKKRERRLAEQREAAERAEREALDAGEALIGPPPPPMLGAPEEKRDFGDKLLAGEGAAMSAFVQNGQRIPRRGEIGLKTEQIEKFENLGYVMSGSRHSRMNAVRMRKEAQIYSAEEKAALAALNKEERAAKEQRVLDDMRALVAAQLDANKRTDLPPPPAE